MKNTLWLLLLGTITAFGCGQSSAPPIPAIVDGDSMAPTVCGEHLLVSCVECQCEFKTEWIAAADFKLTCPNCGYRDLKVDDAKTVGTAEVELLPFARFPRRWDIVGFKLPEEANGSTGVKRIVGLPGETIEIRDGDLYAGKRLLRKSWETQKEVRVSVFDSKFNAVAPFDNANRFRFPATEFGWKVRGSELRFMSGEVETYPLQYIHWRNFRRRGERDKEFPIEDSYGFNQQTVRELNVTSDLMLQLDIEFENDSAIQLEFRRGLSEFEFNISKSETEFLFSWQGASDRKPLVYRANLPEELPRGVVEFSSFDRTIMLRINGTAVFELREDESAGAGDGDVKVETAKDVFSIGGTRGAFRVERFQLWRDIYYLAAPAGFDQAKNLKLTAGADQYVLLGDNSPKSLDSRTWENPGISRSELIGRLVLPLQGE